MCLHGSQMHCMRRKRLCTVQSVAQVRGALDHLHDSVCILCLLHPQGTCAALQELRLQCICGPDGGFLATAWTTLRSLRMEGLPDFKARGMLSHTDTCPSTWLCSGCSGSRCRAGARALPATVSN